MSVLLNFCDMTATIVSPTVAAKGKKKSGIQDIVTRNMKVAMALHNVNQQKLADALGVSRSSISQKMTHRGVSSIDEIDKASQLVNECPEALVPGHGFEPWTSGL